VKALASGDEDADVESIGRFFLEIEEAQEGVGLGDAEVVAGENADVAFAPFAIEGDLEGVPGGARRRSRV